MRWLWALLGVLALGSAEDLKICPPGYTGSSCENPICSSPSNPTFHDGQANMGDALWIHKRSIDQKCNDGFSFFVDDFVGDVFISISSSVVQGSFPVMILSGPNGTEIQESNTHYQSATEKILQYSGLQALFGTGLYSVQVTWDGDCLVKVTSPTTLSVDGGFIVKSTDDNVQTFVPGDNQGIARSPKQGVLSQLAFHVKNEQFPVQPKEVHIYQNGIWNQKFDLLARYGCSFPHVTKQFYNCTDLVPYHALFYGIDDRGNNWQRVYDFSCDAGAVTVPTASPSPMPTVDECYNGGILTNGHCYCGEYYEGLQCEWNLCMNGGTPNLRTETCICAVGYSGNHCQNVQCKTTSDDTFDGNARALAFVVRSASSMQAQMNQIIQAAKNITTSFETTHPGYFKSFVLSVVQNGGVYFTHEFQDAASFISSLQSITHPPTNTECSDALIAAIGEVAATNSFVKYENSPIFVFSDGYSNDDFTAQGYTYEQLAATRAQVYFLLSDSANGGCNIDISSVGYQNLFFTSAYTQGLIVKSTLPNLAQTALEVASTLFKPSIIASNDFLDCRKSPKYKPFFVDDSVKTLYITATGVNLTLSLIQPDLTTITPVVYFFSGNLNIWVIQNPQLGAYMLNLQSAIAIQDICSYRVYSPSLYSLFYATSSDLLSDRTTKEPIANQDSHLVARINNYYTYDPIDVTAEVTVWTHDAAGNRINLYASSGLWRDGCNYNIYFGNFKCQVPFMGFYISVFLTDSNGQTVARTSTGYCASVIPPDPGEQCENGGATYNGTCVCPSHFSGNKCQNINCENQGTPLFGTCKCPPGFDGQFCQTISCNAYNPYVHVDYNDRSLTFLMHDSITTRSVLRSINDVAARVVHDIVHQHQTWFRNYQLMRFNDTDFSIGADGSNPQAFLDGLAKMTTYNQLHSDYSCNNLDMYATLWKALQDDNVAFGGIFYVFLFGSARVDLDSYDKILAHVEENKIQINVVQFSMNPCGNDYTKDGLMSLTQATGGSYILSSGPNAGNVFKSLPTNYQSGLVYEKYAKNCSDTTFYIPVDDSTQAFTAYIQADLKTDPIYTKPDGTVADILSVSNIWHDVAMDSRMDQAIRSCDAGWMLEDGHCWLFKPFPADWQTAKMTCGSLGASLATIYDSAEQTYLDKVSIGAKFWIGLNDIVQQNIWVWDAPNNLSLPLTSTHYTHWAPGQPSVGASKRCVLDDNSNSNGWVTADCGEKHSFACVKNTYNPDFENSNAEPVARGIWGIRIQADGDCSLTVRAQSAVQVLTSYTTNIHSDVGDLEPLSDSGTNRVIAHVTGLTDGVTNGLEYAHMYGDDGTLIQAQNMMHRTSCMFDYISTPFHCPSSAFQMMLTGIDSSGYDYQRIIPVMCTGGVRNTSCENGGTYYQGVCVCAPHFVGSTCQWAQCQNGGQLTGALNHCSCPPSFTGQFCETPVCTRLGSVPDVSSNGRTFILALDGSSTGMMKDVLTNINGTLNGIFNNILFAHSNWFTQFVAVIFRDSGAAASNIPVFSSTLKSTDRNAWIQMIMAELAANPYQSAQGSRAIFSALDQALTDNSVKDRSIAFVLTSGNAEDTRNENKVQMATSMTHTMINMLFMGDHSAPGGSQYTDPSVNDLFETAHLSGGSVYQIPSAKKLQGQWQTILGTLYDTYTIITHHVANCSQYTDYLQLGSNQNDIVIDLFAMGSPTVTMNNPDGVNENGISILVSNTNLITQFTQQSKDPGVWTVGVSSTHNTGTCMFSARAISSLQVYVGFTQNVEQDGGLHDGSAVPYPQAGDQANAVVATSTGLGNNVVLTYAQIFDIEERSLVWASPMILRAACAYPYVSAETFRCDRSNFILAIDGLDSVGHPFRRMFTYHCQGIIYTPPTLPTLLPAVTTPAMTSPPTTSPYATCAASVPVVDLVIAFDDSDTMDSDVYKQTISAFRQLEFAFQIDSTHTQVLMGSYDTGVNFDGTTFANISDTTSYVRRTSVLEDSWTGQLGNNLDGLLRYVNSSQTYRANARKVLVVISTIGWDTGLFFGGSEHGFADPTPEITLLKTKGFEFIPIAFGPQANQQQLSALSTNCLRTANDINGIRNAVSFIGSKLCSTTPVC